MVGSETRGDHVTEAWTIAANVTSDRALRHGAKVIILQMPGGSPEQCSVTGLSKSGRPITKWIATKRLHNPRPAFVHERIRHIPWHVYPDKDHPELQKRIQWVQWEINHQSSNLCRDTP